MPASQNSLSHFPSLSLVDTISPVGKGTKTHNIQFAIFSKRPLEIPTLIPFFIFFLKEKRKKLSIDV